MSFVNAVKRSKNRQVARTENGMKAHATSGEPVLDLFGLIGSARGSNITPQFTSALVDSEELTLRMLLWARDIREGAGERKTFRDLLANLESVNPHTAGKLMHKIPELGRWDDLFTYRDPINRRKAFEMIREALESGNGLCAKWMPRKGAVAVELTKFLGMSPRSYRKMLVGLTNVVETQMCAGNWNEINFSHVPSVASARYQKAFGRHASEAYAAYLSELKKPQSERKAGVKINAGAVYPYDIVKSVVMGNASVADEQWKALPNYVGDARILPMVDVSGSMGSFYYGRSELQPLDVAVSLGLYLSEKNTSEFKDVFLTFSARPEFVTVKGSLTQRMQQMSTSRWEMNTDLALAVDKILSVAKAGKVKKRDMPEVLLVLSDMQFDREYKRYVNVDQNALEMVKSKYKAAGYKMPKIVFWNLSMRGKENNNTPVRFDDKNVAYVSGFSPSIMKSILDNDIERYSPYNVMLKTLMNERYAY